MKVQCSEKSRGSLDGYFKASDNSQYLTERFEKQLESDKNATEVSAKDEVVIDEEKSTKSPAAKDSKEKKKKPRKKKKVISEKSSADQKATKRLSRYFFFTCFMSL